MRFFLTGRELQEIDRPVGHVYVKKQKVLNEKKDPSNRMPDFQAPNNQ